MKAAIYARVSSVDQVAGTSIDGQIADCQAWAGRNGATVVETFTDAGESAKTANRPAFLRLIQFCRKHGCDVVLVHKLDRFARDSHDFAVTRAMLAGYGVQILSVTEPSSDDPAGRFLQTILSAVAQLDNEVRAERSRSGMVDRAAKGFWCHKAPTGFQIKATAAGAILEPDPDEAPAVVSLFADLASGRIAPEQAGQQLTESIGRQFPAQHIRAIVEQRAYRGQICSRLTEGKIIAAQWPGIVDADTWDRANAHFARLRRPEVRGDAREWPLRRWMVCAECGRPLTGSTTKTRYGAWGYYHCPKGHVRIRRDCAHDRMAYLLSNLVAKAKKSVAVLRALTRLSMIDERKRQREISDRQRKVVADMQARQERLLEALLSGTIDDATYRAKASQIATQRAAAWEIVASADQGEMDTDAALDLCEKFLSRIGDLWLTAEPESQNLLMQALIGNPIVLNHDRTVTTNLESGILSILDAIPDTSEKWHPHQGACSNYLARILSVLSPIRKVMEAA
jgi:DNA invertase Pin-like site-specific DNA recombinase